MTPYQAALKGYLEAVAQTMHEQARKGGLVYDGPPGFVLEHGEWFSPQVKPNDVPWGAPNQCHGNALILATLAPERFRLIEGFAITQGFEMVWHHSWVAERTTPTTVCDNTWRLPGLAYLGVEFSPGRSDDATWEGDGTVLDDWKRDYPILRQRWRGETQDVWPATEPTRVLLALKRAGYTLKDIAERSKVWTQ